MIRIRGIERADIDALYALDRLCFRPGIAYSRADLLFFVRHSGGLSFAAVDDASNHLAGFAMGELEIGPHGPAGHIVTIDVDPAQRRQGIGRLLMQAMLDGLSAMHAVAVRLEVAIDNPAAQSFYRSFGFVVTGVEPGFYMGTLDAITMERPAGKSNS